ncbi:Sphingomyelin synthase-related 1 [Schistosoma japonicum]|nr:Sphingomyelin synthase-related 1 [Schistosoma japonicum]
MSLCLHEEIISIHASSLDISKYLINHGVPESISDIFIENIIDGLSFCLLCEKDLNEMGVTQIGLRKRILFLSSFWRHQIKRGGSTEQTLKYIPGDNFAVEFLNNEGSCESCPT